MEMSPILVRDARHVHDTPAPNIAVHMAPEFVEQRGGIETIGLRGAAPCWAIDRARIDHEICDAVGGERAVQPEAVAPGFEATHDRSVRANVEALLRRQDLARQRREVARGNGADPWRLRRPTDAEAELPGRIAEIEREQ
jgi:hypothetical protein